MTQRKIKVDDITLQKHTNMLSKYPRLLTVIEENATSRTVALNEDLSTTPFQLEKKQLVEAEQRSVSELTDELLLSDFTSYSSFMSRIKRPVAATFWEREFRMFKSDSELSTIDKLVLQKWRDNLNKAHDEWELELEQKAQDEFDEKIDKSLSQFHELCDETQGSGLDMEQFFDPSGEGMGNNEFEEIKKQVKKISENDKAREICELMGRTCSKTNKQPTKQKCSSSAIGKELDVQMKDEVVGLEFSNSLSRTLPSELILLDDPDLGILFDLKYVESQLMSYKNIGYQNSFAASKEEKKADQKDGKGPIILCIDTSGSMRGIPEDIAKSVTLFMATLAKQENRNCYLINFSSKIECLDLSDGVSSTVLYKFLEGSFHGGTDIEPALLHGVKIMKTDSYKNADLLVISDMEEFVLSESLIERMNKLRTTGNSFLGLCVKEYSGRFEGTPIEDLFDEAWTYNTQTNSIVQLITKPSNSPF